MSIQRFRQRIAEIVGPAVLVLTLGRVTISKTGAETHNRAEKPPVSRRDERPPLREKPLTSAAIRQPDQPQGRSEATSD